MTPQEQTVVTFFEEELNKYGDFILLHAFNQYTNSFKENRLHLMYTKVLTEMDIINEYGVTGTLRIFDKLNIIILNKEMDQVSDSMSIDIETAERFSLKNKDLKTGIRQYWNHMYI